MSRRTGKWTSDENGKLKDAVKTHDGNNWFAIARLVPGWPEVNVKEGGGNI
jgi:hypothetical protein